VLIAQRNTSNISVALDVQHHDDGVADFSQALRSAHLRVRLGQIQIAAVPGGRAGVSEDVGDHEPALDDGAYHTCKEQYSGAGEEESSEDRTDHEDLFVGIPPGDVRG
jgi:hypothetical protein